MKRIAVLFLILALLLTACAYGEDPAPASGAKETRTAAPTAARPTESDTRPTESDTRPTEPEPTGEDDWEDPDDSKEDLDEKDTWEDLDYPEPETTEPEPTLPQEPIDWQVHTDWSHYRPYSGSGAKYTRLREGPLDQFEPSEDYGAVYPYIATQYDRFDEGGDSLDPYVGQPIYGIVDRSGRILTDGLYRDVIPLENRGESTGDCAYWEVSRMIGLRDPSKEYMDLTGEQHPDFRYGLISLDGSFALDCVYQEIYDTGNGIFCRGEGGAADFTVYDSDWTPMFTGAAVAGGQTYDYISLEYGEGLYLVSGYTATFDEEIGFYTAVKTCWFCGGDGKQVLGPYQDASTFHEGLACVKADGELYGYIDQTGNYIMEPAFDRQEDFENGRVVQSTADGDIVVIDRSGNTLFSLNGIDGRKDDFGYYSYSGYYTDDLEYYYDRNGVLVYSGTDLDRLDEDVFAAVTLNGTVSIVTPERTLLTVETELIERFWSFYPCRLKQGAFLKGGALLLGWYGGQACDGTGRVFIPSDFSEVITRPDPSLPSVDLTEPFLSVQNEISGELWYFCWTGTSWEGRTEAGTRCTVPVWAIQLQPMGDMVFVRTKDANCLVTFDGEIVFRRPVDQGD